MGDFRDKKKLITMRKIILLCFAVSLILIDSCLNNNSSNTSSKVYKVKYYASGELQNKGWYINDTIPVDTIFEYQKNGKLSSIAVYNSNGKLTGGSEVFFENGDKSQINNFFNDQLQGFSYEFHKNGYPYNKVFYLKGKQIGDYYEYDNKGRLSIKYFNF